MAAQLSEALTKHVDLFYLDERRFSPTQPTGYSWSRHRERRAVHYEVPEGRRVNALVTYGFRQRRKTLLFTVKSERSPWSMP